MGGLREGERGEGRGKGTEEKGKGLRDCGPYFFILVYAYSED
jgi:hypothetical protein